MGQYLIDSSSVAKYLQGIYTDEVNTFLDGVFVESDFFAISFITKIELLSYNPQTSNPEIVLYKQKVQDFIDSVPMILVNNNIIKEAVRIRKTTRIKLPDAIIGATALDRNLTLISSNASDFDKVVPLGLSFINLI